MQPYFYVTGNVPQAAAPGEGILHVGFFMFGNVQKKLDGQWRIEREKGTDYRGDGRMRRVPQ